MEYSNLRIHKETAKQLKALAKIFHKTQLTVMDDLVEEFLKLAVNFRYGNYSFETSLLTNTLSIEIQGQSRLVTGSFEIPVNASEKQTDKEIRYKIKKRRKP